MATPKYKFQLYKKLHAETAAIYAEAKAFGSELLKANGIAPGSIMFEGTRKLFYANPETANAIISHFPIGVPGEPEDIAAATCYLASEDAKFVVGAIMTVDGGWICGYNREL